MIDIDIKAIKYKLISFAELKLHLDRLTRFKYPRTSYGRVFKEIIFKNLLYPKLNAKTLDELDTKVLVTLVENIWNKSVNDTVENDGLVINSILKKEATQTFFLDEESLSYLESKLCLSQLVKTLVEPDEINLKRLTKLSKQPERHPDELRSKCGLRFPLRKIVLVEGITEDILLPKLAKISGYDFDKNGVKIVGAGGKNQVAKLYLRFLEEVKLPMFVLLDADGAQTASILNKVKRPCDKIYIIKNGEFEDVIPKSTIYKALNLFYKNMNSLSGTELNEQVSTVEQLEELYKFKGFGDFKKAVFAKQLNEVLNKPSDVSSEVASIITEIKNL